MRSNRHTEEISPDIFLLCDSFDVPEDIEVQAMENLIQKIKQNCGLDKHEDLAFWDLLVFFLLWRQIFLGLGLIPCHVLK